MRAGFPSRVRLLTLVKWTSAVMVVVLLLMWAISLVWWVQYFTGETRILLCSHCLMFDDTDWTNASGVWQVHRSTGGFTEGLVPYLAAGQGILTVRVPFWCLLPLPLFVWIAARQLDARFARRASNACSRCAYDRAGLKPEAACPECGAPATARE